MSESNASLLLNDKQANDLTCAFQISLTNPANTCVLLLASSLSEKQSWCSDLSQVCLI